MKSNSFRYGILGLLVISAVAGILTFSYQGWNFLIRLAVIFPLMASLFLSERLGRILRIALGGIGAVGFGFFVYVWSIYPFGRAFAEGWKYVALGIEIGLLGVFSVIYVLSGFSVVKSPVWVMAAGIPVLVLLAALLVYHSFIQPAGIAMEFCSYLPYFAALILMTKSKK
jgi:hypothetical protein